MENHIDDPSWLGDQYRSGRTLQDIADELGVHRNTVRNRLVSFGINRRDCGEYMKGKPKPPEQRAKMAAARKAFWDDHPERDAFKLKVSEARRKSGVNVMGYRWVYVLGRGKVAEHRLVMETIVGRRLSPEEHVHHIDGDKLNNHPDNLQLTNASEHRLIHVSQGDTRGYHRKGRRKTAVFASSTHKECCKCHAIKERSEFSPCKIPGRDPHTTRCKACAAADKRAKRLT